MVSEEIHLNDYLESQGISAVETDLGEYIIQIAGEGPSHIIVPAIHKDRRQVGKLFAEKLGCEYSDDPAVLTKIAKKVLREEFLSAKAGISGANFAVADSGSIVLFTNEGNGRMCTTLPPLHIAGTVYREDGPVAWRIFPNSSGCFLVLPRAGAHHVHVSDNRDQETRRIHRRRRDAHRLGGQRQVRRSSTGEYREMLKCIRCGACLNACPVYRMVGGHAYGSTYPGPMGIVLTTLLEGMERAHPLLDATTLCGACGDVCPVKVPLPELLRKIARTRVEEGFYSEDRANRHGGIRQGRPSRRSFSTWARPLAHVFWPMAKRIGPTEALDRLPRPVANNIQAEGLMTREEIIDLFIENAAKVAAEPVRVTTVTN